MLKSCSICGKLHKFDELCPVRAEREKRRIANYDKKYERNSDEDRFRNTKRWQRKREEIRTRDLNICRCCFFRHHRIITSSLSVHHIVPLKERFDLRLDDSNLITLCRNCHEEAESGLISTNELRSYITKKIKLA